LRPYFLRVSAACWCRHA